MKLAFLWNCAQQWFYSQVFSDSASPFAKLTFAKLTWAKSFYARCFCASFFCASFLGMGVGCSVPAEWKPQPRAAPPTPRVNHAASPRFVNQAVAWNLNVPGKRAVLGDLNGDGWLDLILDAKSVYHNQADSEGQRTFVEVTEYSRFQQSGIASFIVLADVDNDGDLDVFCGQNCPLENWQTDKKSGEILKDAMGNPMPRTADDGLRSRILLNDGLGRFTVLANSGVEFPAVTSTSACFLDFDRDGVLDLFVGNGYRSYGINYKAYSDRLFRGLGDGRFEDVTEQYGLIQNVLPGRRDSAKPTYGVAAADINKDGWPDLLTSSYGRQWNQLWIHRGDHFAEQAEIWNFDGDDLDDGKYPDWTSRNSEEPYRSNGNSFGVAVADYDRDGDLDVFLNEITHAWAGAASDLSSLLINHGDHFDRRLDVGIERQHLVKRWNQGDIYSSWLDANADGLLDLLISSGDYPDNQRLRIFRQRQNRGFKDSTQELEIDWQASSQPTIGDVDNDGDPDLLVGRSLFRLNKAMRQQLGKKPALWIQQAAPTGRKWIKIQLIGQGAGAANRQGIGSTVQIEAAGERQSRTLMGGQGHSGQQNPAEIHFAIPADCQSVQITVKWADRTGSISIFEGIEPSSDLRLKQSK